MYQLIRPEQSVQCCPRNFFALPCMRWCTCPDSVLQDVQPGFVKTSPLAPYTYGVPILLLQNSINPFTFRLSAIFTSNQKRTPGEFPGANTIATIKVFPCLGLRLAAVPARSAGRPAPWASLLQAWPWDCMAAVIQAGFQVTVGVNIAVLCIVGSQPLWNLSFSLFIVVLPFRL